MKVLAINGSPNKAGNTFLALSVVGKELTDAGIDFEVLHIGNKLIHGCTACYSCGKNQDEKCIYDEPCCQHNFRGSYQLIPVFDVQAASSWNQTFWKRAA